MNGGVGLLHLRCAGSGHAAELLRRRLTETARTHLPDALGRALGDDTRRVFAERVHVELDFDPSDYDDVTVAALWAGRIERALAGAGEGRPAADARVEGLRSFASDREFLAGALAEAATAGRLSWVYAELPCGTGDVSAGELLRSLRTRAEVAAAVGALAAGETLSRSVFDALDAVERAELVEALRGRRAWPAGGVRSRAPALGDSPAARSPAPGSTARDEEAGAAPAVGSAAVPSGAASGAAAVSFADWRRALAGAAAGGAASIVFGGDPGGAPGVRSSARGRQRPSRPGGDSPRGGAAGPRAPGARGGSQAPRPSVARSPEPASRREADAEDLLRRDERWSLVGGLVLLYPWLDSYLEPERAPDDAARVAALVALADPERPELAADPLVRVLAGAPLDGEPAEPELPEGLDPARVLAAFAAALPGFGESTPDFLRAHFLARGALVEPLEDRLVRVVLEPLPLDPLLELLPYPLAPFALPWTAMILPERRRA